MTQGFLKYEDTDASILIKVPLTSEPSDLEMGASGNLNDVDGSTFDANGFKANAGGYMRYQGMGALLAGNGERRSDFNGYSD